MTSSAPAQRDDWDQHWVDFSPASDIAPSTAWRCRLIDKLLALPKSGEARVLEIGSGTGAFARRFVQKFPQTKYLGLDISATGVAMSSRQIPTAEFRQRDLLLPRTAEDNCAFGATHAICSEVLEHVDDPVGLIRNSLDYMAPGCKLVVTVPGGPVSAFHRHIGHRKHFRAEELRALLTEAGMDVQLATGAGFPFYNAYLGSLVLRGEKAITMVSGEPGILVRTAASVFDFLFRFNLMSYGWQILAIATKPAHA